MAAKTRTNQVISKRTVASNVAQPAPVSDIQNHPARSAIMALEKQGVIQALPDGRFRPDAPVTDAEFNGLMQKAFARGSQSATNFKRPANVVTRADAAQFVFNQALRAETISQKTQPQVANPPVKLASAIAQPETVAMASAGNKSLTDESAKQATKHPMVVLR